jgi:hypothetical protein
MAAGAGDDLAVEHRRQQRALDERRIRMELQFAARQGADQFAVFADIADQHQPGIGIGPAFLVLAQLGLGGLAEIAGEADLLGLAQILIAEQQHVTVEPCRVQGRDGLMVQRFAKVQPLDFGAEAFGQLYDVERR